MTAGGAAAPPAAVRRPAGRTRRAAGGGLLVVVEVAVLRGYLSRGTGWHFLLHSLIGVGLGSAAAGALRSPRPLRWAALGQLVSVLPDLLFLTTGLPHEPWMDVFVGHVTIHVTAAPLLVGLAVWLLGLSAWWCGRFVSRRSGSLVAACTVAVLAAPLLAARPLPSHLDQLTRPGPQGGARPVVIPWCR